MNRILAILSIAILITGCAGTPHLTSPNGKIALDINQDSTTTFTVKYVNGNSSENLFTISSLGVMTSDSANVSNNFSFKKTTPGVKSEYTMLTGKKSVCTNEYNEYEFASDDIEGVSMILRIYNDGITLRYVTTPDSPIVGEITQYTIDADKKRWMQRYDPGYERFFPEQTGHNQKDDRWGYPALVEFSDSTWGLFTEAAIEKENCASLLKATDNESEYAVEWASSASCTATPWRVVIIGSLNDIVESTLVTDVSPEARIDTSWIEPGVASWIYWAHNHGSKDYQILKQYIDLADTLNLPYTLIDAEWDEMSNGGDINDVAAYAASKGVKPLIWYNSSTGWINGAPGPKFRLNKPEDREKEFAWLEDNGFAGVKIDFFPGDGQETMNYYIDLLESAAKHHLLVNFHGATVPRGWQRTYPNLMSVEGVYGAEWYNNAPILTNRAAAHNATLPFTRNVIGPMDYTPCTFSDSQHPHITSHGHELALTVLFESGIQHLADRPESYLAQPAEVLEFFSTLPSTWDETKLLAGYPGNHTVIARRKGSDWYIAGINGTDEPMEVTPDYSPVNKGEISGTMFTDSGKPDNPWSISSITSLPEKINMQPRGGFVIKMQ